MRRSLIVSLALLIAVSAPALAQTCLGLASYSDGPLQATGSGWLANQASSFGAGIGYGRPASLFGGLAIGSTSDNSIGGSSLELGASVGYQIPLGRIAGAGTQLCPVASFGVGLGPKDPFNSGVDRSDKTASVGLAVGTSFIASPQLKVIPMVELAYAHRQDKAENNAGVNLFEISENHAQLQLGVGLVLNSNISLRPSASIALGLAGPDPTVGITLGYNFGSARSSPR